MPMNGEEPLYHLIREMAAEPEWGLRDAVLQTNETLTPAAYFDILTGCAADFDMWEVKYYHPLADHRALVEWVKGTKLRPYLDFLGAERGRQFEEALAPGGGAVPGPQRRRRCARLPQILLHSGTVKCARGGMSASPCATICCIATGRSRR